MTPSICNTYSNVVIYNYMLSERMPHSRLGRAALVFGATALAAAGQLAFGGDNKLDANPDRTDRTERYDANCGAISAEGTTVTPVVRTIRGKEELFRIIGYGKEIRLEKIEPTARVHEQWAVGPDLTVISDEGTIRTDTVDGTPVVDMELSNHAQITRAVGQTSPTTAQDLRNTGCK